MSFSFTTPKSATGFTLPTTAAPAIVTSTPGGFQLGAGAGGDIKAQQNKPGGLGLFGTPPAQSAGFSLTSTPVKTTSTTGFSFSATPTAAPINATTSAGGTPQFSFGSNLASAVTSSATTTSAPLSFGVSASSSAPQTGFASFGTTTSSGLQLATSVAPTTSALSFKLPTVTTSSLFGTTPSTAAATTTTNTTAPPLSFGLSSTTTTSSAAVATTLATSSVTGVASALPQTPTLTFAQLEDAINKWTIDLEEQGKLFFNQAKQLNAWDRLLITNGEKILNLNNGVDRVKQQQQQLDQALDFILAQQKELEDLIVPLENELTELPVTDQDRSRMYQLAENMDSQLKQMSEDLKEIIEHLNETNKTEEESDPMVQIGRILNAHMNSLYWIDRKTAEISAHLDSITKMQDSNRHNISHF